MDQNIHHELMNVKDIKVEYDDFPEYEPQLPANRTIISAINETIKTEIKSEDESIYLNIPEEEKPFECSICHFKFKLKYLKSHMRFHPDVKQFSCEVCLKKFKTRSALKCHSYMHSEEKPFACPECPKTFKANGNLSAHMRVHTGTNPHQQSFECMTCSKMFITCNYLKRHIFKAHTEERPFGCTKCRKKFKSKFDLNIHMRVHTGERPFQCHKCLKKFTSNSVLKRHITLHSKFFLCDCCSIETKRKKDLIKHMKMHTCRVVLSRLKQ